MSLLRVFHVFLVLVLCCLCYPQAITDETNINSSFHRQWPAGPFSTVSTAHGSLITQVPLIDLDGPGRTKLSFGIYHRSNQTVGTVYGTVNGGVGRGWDHTLRNEIVFDGSKVREYLSSNNVGTWTVASVGGGGVLNGVTRRGGTRSDFTRYVSFGVPTGYDVIDQETKIKREYRRKLGTMDHFFITKIVDPDGNALLYQYDANNRITQVTDAAGRALVLTYASSAASSQLSSVSISTTSGTRTWTFIYGTNSQGLQNFLGGVRYPNPNDGSATTGPFIELFYNSQASLSAVRDLRGYQWNYAYATQSVLGNQTAVTSVLDPFALNDTEFSYSQQGGTTNPRVCSITDPLNKIWKHEYLAAVNVTDPFAADYQYMENPILRVYDPTFTFLDGGTYTAWETFYWNYDSGTLRRYENKLGRATEFTYDSNRRGLMTEKKQFYNASQFYTTTYSYSNDRLTLVTDPVGDQVANTWDYTLDRLLTKVVDPGGVALTTTNTYTLSGELASVKVGADNATTYSNFDAYGNARTVTAPNGFSTTLTFDAFNNLLTSLEPNPGGLTAFLYDYWNRKLRTTNPDSSSSEIGYDNNSNVISTKDELGYITTNAYDSRNRLFSTSVPVDSNSTNNLVTTYGYNDRGERITITNPRGKITSYTYNERGDLNMITYPDSTTRRYDYNPVGDNTVIYNGRNQLVVNTFDWLRRNTYVDYSDGITPDVSYSYRPDGLVEATTDGTGTSTYTYNDAKQLMSHFQAGPAMAVAYTYDAAGRKETMSVGAQTWTYDYNAAGQLEDIAQTIGDLVPATFTYKDNGALYRRNNGDGKFVAFTYSNRGWITGVAHRYGQSVLQNVTTDYNFAGNPISQSHVVTGGPSWTTTYSHDRADRLVSEVRSGSTGTFNNSYNYDKNGNRLSVTRDGSTYMYGAVGNNDQFSSGEGYAFSSYDTDGNPLTVSGPTGIMTFSYFQHNRPRALTMSSGTETMVYDGQGRRTKVTRGNGVVTHFVYDGDTLVHEYSVGKGTTWGTYFLAGIGYYNTADAKQMYLHENAIGSIIAESYSPGAPVVPQYGTSEYDAYGNTTYETAGVSYSPHRFIGKFGYYSEASSGMQLLGARFYIPRLGRFLTQDPLGLEGGLNLYAYCDNSPLNKIDPDGKSPDGQSSVGEPSLGESLIPIWGSGRAAINDFQQGRIGWGLVNTALCISDCVMVGTVVKSVVALGVKGTLSIGAKSWGSSRKLFGAHDFAARGQHMHHPIKQKYFQDDALLKLFLNQPFMVTNIPTGGKRYKGVDYTMQGWHMLLDGVKVKGNTLSLAERAFWGTNGFHKAAAVSNMGRIGSGANGLRN